MSALQAIPTEHGIDILNSELKDTVTKYQLIGALTHDANSADLYSFHNALIETSYFDENGVLTFILNLPIETHFDEYLHKINVLDSTDQIVIECDTPKVALAKGIGGMVTLKAAISGQAGEVIFKHSEYVTKTELDELYLTNMVGLIGEFHHPGSKPGWLDLKGGEFSRITDKPLWDYAQETGQVISQATKDADPMANAMKFGDGDGATTFTLPNHHLGHFVRGTVSGESHGQTSEDSIREHHHDLKLNPGMSAANTDGAGAISSNEASIGRNTVSDSSHTWLYGSQNYQKMQLAGSETKPKTANLSIKIHRGWM
ncbi:hypothetical protein [Vibrio sp. HN007]|uniref:hypothetical protein n=1 Tax=Vibrio iocasae TaxID=3098914 RepID=UPI0035D3FDD0